MIENKLMSSIDIELKPSKLNDEEKMGCRGVPQGLKEAQCWEGKVECPRKLCCLSTQEPPALSTPPSSSWRRLCLHPSSFTFLWWQKSMDSVVALIWTAVHQCSEKVLSSISVCSRVVCLTSSSCRSVDFYNVNYVELTNYYPMDCSAM